MLGYIQHKLKSVKNLSMPYDFSFIVGHSYLSDTQVEQIENILVSGETDSVRLEYEKRFAALIGCGYGISFAAGRMALYQLMIALGIGEGHEVILPGFTCSVMVNAILRIGAIPIFSDIDIDTFGSSAIEIEKKISANTKLIVAQHSFGIPCKIEEIMALGKSKGIFVVEDCALTLDSSVKGIKVGNFGDAAIFSTDHTKPLNTLIGGFFYTNNKSLYDKVCGLSAILPDLDKQHQSRLYNQFLFERKYYEPYKYKSSFIANLYHALLAKVRKGPDNKIFLGDDYYNNILSMQSYPYPAKLPSFLAQIGLFELNHWHSECEQRIRILNQYVNIMLASNSAEALPAVYKNKDLEIVPLRFVFTCTNADNIKKAMSKDIAVNLILFNSPIVCCPEGLSSFGYSPGTCQTSERVCPELINFPCILPEKYHSALLGVFKRLLLSGESFT